MDKETRMLIWQTVDYCWHDESRHYHEMHDHGETVEDHFFLTLKTLNERLDLGFKDIHEGIPRMKFRGIEIEVTPTRIKQADRTGKLYYYECRHGDSDWSEPSTVEHRVVVNFWGTVTSEVPLEFKDGEDYLDLTQKERFALSVEALSPKTFNAQPMEKG